MDRYFFPFTSDGDAHDDTVGSEHETKEGAIKEGHTYLREMASERLRQGETHFAHGVTIKDAEGAVLKRYAVTVTLEELS